MEIGRKQLLGRPLNQILVPDLVNPLLKEIKRQARVGAIKDSAVVSFVLPLQIITLGALALVCCPGEVTTTAVMRLVQTM